MNPLDLTASVTAVSNAIACKLSDDELSIAAAAFTQLGDTLATISVMRGMNNQDRDKKDNNNKDDKDCNRKNISSKRQA